MIWWQAECKYGDIIRVSFGNFYHYGIFVSEKEVIQFGLPPFEGLFNRNFEEIAVCISNIDTFSGGRIVEVGAIEKTDKKRLSPKKTVQRAREKLGEKGYDILHNNCEHFARYCYFGEKACEVTESVRNKWKKKTICDVYFSVIPDEIEYKDLYPKERMDEILSVSNEGVKKSKYWVWKTLEYAVYRSFGYKIQDLKFSKTKSGKWACGKCFFSLSHSKNAVAVILSNKETGIDLEEKSSFYDKVKDEKTFSSLVVKILSKGEDSPKNIEDLLYLWTKKECFFKSSNKKVFSPSKVSTKKQDVLSLQTRIGEKEYACSVMGKNIEDFRFYLFDGESTTKYKDIEWKQN